MNEATHDSKIVEFAKRGIENEKFCTEADSLTEGNTSLLLRRIHSDKNFRLALLNIIILMMVDLPSTMHYLATNAAILMVIKDIIRNGGEV